MFEFCFVFAVGTGFGGLCLTAIGLGAWLALRNTHLGKPGSDSTPVFLSGSRAYGVPNAESDIDLVVQGSESDFDEVARVMGSDKAWKNKDGGSIKDGRLNLIWNFNPKTYRAWQLGTARLRERAPCSRAEAIKLFEELGVGAVYRAPAT